MRKMCAFCSLFFLLLSKLCGLFPPKQTLWSFSSQANFVVFFLPKTASIQSQANPLPGSISAFPQRCKIPAPSVLVFLAKNFLL
jgi:hypothetical protein